MEETPTQSSAISQKVWPRPLCGDAGDSMPPPLGMPALARVGYEVQPDPPAPPPTKNDARMVMNAGHMNQYDIMFSLGNAMSRAPIISGMRKLPNAPVSQGMMTKKIITEACMLNAIA